MTGQSWPVVACTGHRYKNLPNVRQRIWVQENLFRAAVWVRDNCGTTVGLSGMAAGSDLWWAAAVHKAGLTLGAHIPCPQQTGTWPAHTAAEWERLRQLADPAWSKTVADKYSYAALFARNLGMMRAATAVVAVWNPALRGGGTYDALCQATALKRPGIHLDPATETVTFHLPHIERPARRSRKDPRASTS